MARPKQDKCKRGHRITESPSGRRYCRQCNVDRMASKRHSSLQAEVDRRYEEVRQQQLNGEITIEEFQRIREDENLDGDGNLRRNRKRFVKVSKKHNKLCSKCQLELFPPFKQIPKADS